MSSDIYTVLALLARYGFALLMVFVVLRAFVMTKTDTKRAKKLRGAEQPIGELRSKGRSLTVYPILESGCIGSGKDMDVILKGKGIRRKHAYFEQRTGGVLFESIGGAPLAIGRNRHKTRQAIVRNGDVLYLGDTALTLVLYSASRPLPDADDFFGEDT